MVNSLLDSLPADEASRVLAELELVALEPRQVLCEQGQVIGDVYFPITGMISLLRTMNDRTVVESGAVGYEGMLGLPVFLGAGISDSLCRVQVRGEAWRVSSEGFLRLITANHGLSGAVGLYTAATLAAALQLAACNLLHPLSQRCSRTLLAIHDHVAEDDLLVTHEQLAQMLGVRRAGVTATLGVFQARQILTSRRGVITILDRQRLEAEACECGAVIRALYNS
jgi:CRP-like cAMP-binding protein